MSQDEIAVNEEVVQQDTTPPASATDETISPEVADPLLDVLSSDDDETVAPAETKEEPEAEEPEAPEETQDTQAEEQPLGEEKPLSTKAENRFQKLANENRALREQIEQLNAQVYAPQTVEELVDEGLTPEMAEVRALKQELELQAYNNRVVEAQTALSEESAQVMQDFPIFNPDSPEFDADIAAAAAQSLQASLIQDPNTGQIIGSHLSPYQIYKPIYDAYRKSRLEGQLKGQKATAQMLSAVDATPSATPKEPKKDPLLEILASDD